MATTSKAIVPGPKGHFLFGHLKELKHDPIALFMDGVRRYGDIVSFDFLGQKLYLLNHPDYVKHPLLSEHKNYTKQTHGVKKLLVFGSGLVTSEGKLWERQRKLIQPFFHRQCIEKFFDIMLGNANELTQKLAFAQTSEVAIDFTSEITQLTQKIVCQALFGANLDGLERLEAALKYYLHEARVRTYRIPNFPLWVPTRPNREFSGARRVLFQFVDAIIQKQSEKERPGHNLLTMLMTATDPETGEGMSETQVRDEIQTFLIAGHDTTANNLIWTIYLLSRHPEIKKEIINEIDTVLNGEPLSLQTLPELKITRSVILESLRCYPPVWLLPRSPKTDVELGGYIIPAGSSVYISPYLLHRHPEIWKDPETFDPRRFFGDREKAIPKLAYLPFGTGPRQCIGKEFALMESTVILATIFKDYDLTTEQELKPKAGITLKASPDLVVRVTSRSRFRHTGLPGNLGPDHRRQVFAG